MKTAILTMRMANGRLRNIGAVENDILFTLRKPHHFMVKYQGFGLSQAVIDRLIEKNIKWVVIKYLGKSVCEYKVNVQQFIDSDKMHTFTNDEGKDLQKFVSVKDMEEIGKCPENVQTNLLKD